MPDPNVNPDDKTPGYIRDLPPEERRLWKALAHEDDLGAVIRTQTFLESYVERLLRRHFLDESAKVNIRGIQYSIRLQLLHALHELDEDLVRSLLVLEKLRDKFAHDPQMEMSEELHRQLIDSLEGNEQLIYEANLDDTFGSFGGNTENETNLFGHLSVSQRELRAALDALRTVVSVMAKSPFKLAVHVDRWSATEDA